nr:MAG TPA: hypothetical protein [Caudoviricetes sp.]
MLLFLITTISDSKSRSYPRVDLCFQIVLFFIGGIFP